MEPFKGMDTVFSDFNSNLRGAGAGFMTAIDVYEDENNITVETQLAGVDPEKVDITIENDVLSIKGESEKKSEVEDKNYYRKEIRRGSFYRLVPLPAHVLGDKASASADEGVLKIVIPKVAQKKSKTIKIIKLIKKKK